VPGTCTMHASSVDLSKTLVALGKAAAPPTSPVFVPTPNHSHVVDDSRVNAGAIRDVHGDALPAGDLIRSYAKLPDQFNTQLPGTTEDRRPASHKTRAYRKCAPL